MLFEGTHWQLVKVNKISDNFYKEEQLFDCMPIYLDDNVLWKWGLPLKKEFASKEQVSLH